MAVGAQGAATQAARGDLLSVKSPDDHLAFEIWADATGGLRYQITRDGVIVVEPSAAGIGGAVTGAARGLTPDCTFAVASGDRAVSAYMRRIVRNL
jgi:hypothetical protein